MNNSSSNLIWSLIAIISCGGMFMYFYFGFEYDLFNYIFRNLFVFLTILILYLVSLFNVFTNIKVTPIKKWRGAFWVHLIFVLTLSSIYVKHSELFKSEPILVAIYQDDLFYSELTLRENGNFDEKMSGFLGYNKVNHGTYQIKGDTLRFNLNTLETTCLKSEMLMNLENHAIFLERNQNGNFNINLEWLNHFKVTKHYLLNKKSHLIN